MAQIPLDKFKTALERELNNLLTLERNTEKNYEKLMEISSKFIRESIKRKHLSINNITLLCINMLLYALITSRFTNESFIDILSELNKKVVNSVSSSSWYGNYTKIFNKIKQIINIFLNNFDMTERKILQLIHNLTLDNLLKKILYKIIVVFHIKDNIKVSTSINNQNELVIKFENNSIFYINFSFKFHTKNISVKLDPHSSKEIIVKLFKKDSYSDLINLQLVIHIPSIKERYIKNLTITYTLPLSKPMSILIAKKSEGNSDELLKINYIHIVFGGGSRSISQLTLAKSVDKTYLEDLINDIIRKVETDSDVTDLSENLTAQIIPRRLINRLLSKEYEFLIILTDLSRIPWEMLYTENEGFLSERIPVMRQVLSEEIIESRSEKIRTAFLLGNPDGSLRNAELEVSKLNELLLRYGIKSEVMIPYKDIDDLNDIFNKLIRIEEPLIFHLASHVNLSENNEPLFPIRVKKTLDSHELSLRTVFNVLKPGSIVFLNACKSLSDKTFTILDSLIRDEKNLSAFIGTRTLINDRLSVEFSSTLYTNLIRGKTLGESILLARKSASKISKSRWLSFVAYGDALLRIR